MVRDAPDGGRTDQQHIRDGRHLGDPGVDPGRRRREHAVERAGLGAGGAADVAGRRERPCGAALAGEPDGQPDRAARRRAAHRRRGGGGDLGGRPRRRRAHYHHVLSQHLRHGEPGGGHREGRR